ncbi:MAG: beta-glucosidase [Bacteroidetes bacterium]|nr:MAG: beta-glucosidase [Bacteroidota bacterium]
MQKYLLLHHKIIVILLISIFYISCSNNNNNKTELENLTDQEIKEILYPTNIDKSITYLNPDISIDERVSDLLSKMSIEDKAAQMVQGERKFTSNKDILKYGMGSVLSGGGSTPGQNKVEDWNKLIKDYQVAAFSRDLKIPIIYGVDAVHGHANVVGATIFPHNIGLGAANNDSLMFEMGKITAKEVFSTGINWNFAPCVALAMDPRWGRTYESFSTEEEIVTRLGRAYTKGANSVNMVACAKHYLGDGGTAMGTGLDNKMDRGNTIISEEELKTKLLPPYKAQVDQGVQTIMPSYSSINGTKMHQHDQLINGILKNEMNFNGFVISDWEAMEEIPDASFEEQVWIAINSGVDMLMQPETWKNTIDAIIKGIKNDKITQARIDDAVSRILKVKFESGLFEDPLLQKNENKAEMLRSEEAVHVATQLVEQSLVLLKNENNILPLKENIKLYIAGAGANNIGLQCGGWTIDWQGKIDSIEKITPGVSILEGLQTYAESKNIQIITDESEASETDIVLMVLSEKPYAEMQGDSEDLSLTGSLAHDGNKETIQFVESLNKPTVSILMAGRHLVNIDDYLNDWESVVMAYLPGSEGGQGIANVLVGKKNFVGKLAMPWYKDVKDIRKENVELLYKIGYGLSY